LLSYLRSASAVLATCAVLTAPVGAQAPAVQGDKAHNAIIFVADGLRHDAVNAADSPTLFALRREGVEFANSHAVFPTVTTPNAAAIATGHAPGDTGDFSNAQYIGFPLFEHGNFGRSAATSVPFLENDPILGDIDDHLGGNFLR
jgi:hypothetical protein